MDEPAGRHKPGGGPSCPRVIPLEADSLPAHGLGGPQRAPKTGKWIEHPVTGQTIRVDDVLKQLYWRAIIGKAVEIDRLQRAVNDDPVAIEKARHCGEPPRN